jgi:hypothetical protein
MSFGGGGGSGGTIGTATDVVLSNPSTNDYLGYVNGVNKWENLTLTGRAALANSGGAEGVVALGSKTGAVTLDLSTGNVVSVTLTGTVTLTLPTFTGTAMARSFGFYVKQDGTGSRTITWPASVKWAGGTAPTLSTGANALDILVFETIDGGTNWYGSLVGTNFS